MGNPKHQELETKISAAKVTNDEFRRWCWERKPSRYLHVVGPDVYYGQGPNVLRHRLNGGAGELTVKRRTSRRTTRNRLEIDLAFAERMVPADITAFLLATGWKPLFTIVKQADIFWFDDNKPGVEAVIYDSVKVTPKGVERDPRRFLEIEIHKEDSNHPAALSTLKQWEREARAALPLGPTVNESLYEIYSGKRYGMARR